LADIGRAGSCQRCGCINQQGDYLTSSPPQIEAKMVWHFRTSAEAHAMQIWLEGHVRPHDPWQDRQRSYEGSRLRMREMADIINGAAATGLLSRILKVPHYRERVELLRSFEPRIGQMDADKVVLVLASSAPYPGL
jgi:hypothetical protein